MQQSQLFFEDLNQIIKLFSYSIQQRISQLNATQTINHSRSQYHNEFIQKYQHCKINTKQQLQIINKFGKRVMQVFSYFKGRSHHKNVLNIVEEKLVNSIDEVLTNKPMMFGQLIKLLFTFSQTPFQSSKNVNITQLSMSSVKIKINYHQKSKTKTVCSIPLQQSQIIPTIDTHCLTTTQTTKCLNVQKVQFKHMKTSTSGIYVRKHIIQSNKSLHKKIKFQQQDLKYYSDLNIYLDKRYMLQINQQSYTPAIERLQKQFLKRNENIKNCIQSYNKKFENSRPQISPILSQITKKSNITFYSGNKLKINKYKKQIQNITHRQNKNYRAQTSLKQQQEIQSNLFRQRKYKKSIKQNTRSSLSNNIMNIDNNVS